jgi:pimeloyl-ACP methyl ester carboxylesterase
MSTVGETMPSSVVGDASWEGLPEQVKQIFTANDPAIVAKHRGGPLDISAEQLGTIVHPTLLVAGSESHRRSQEVTNLMAEAMPEARVEWVEGGHVINPAHPAVLSFVDEVPARSPQKTRMKEEPSTA